MANRTPGALTKAGRIYVCLIRMISEINYLSIACSLHE